jgi:hypothetical protein
MWSFKYFGLYFKSEKLKKIASENRFRIIGKVKKEILENLGET